MYDRPAETTSIINDVFLPYALPSDLIASMSTHITSLPANLQVEFLMHFHHKSTTEQSDRAIWSAITIGLGYFLGGVIPLLPYILAGKDCTVHTAFWWSCFVMAIALFTFGAVKTRLLLDDKPTRSEGNCTLQGTILGFPMQDAKQYLRGGAEMIVLGGFTAGAAMIIVRLVQE